MGKTHQRNVSHVSLASTASGAGTAPRSWNDHFSTTSSSELDRTPLVSPRVSPRDVRVTDVVALVDKFAFRTELDVPETSLKRFKTAAACTKWLAKCLHKTDQRVVIVAKAQEVAMLHFLEGAGRSRAVAGVVLVGVPVDHAGVVPVRQVASLEDAVPAAAALLAAPTVAEPAGTACADALARVAAVPGRPVWIDAGAASSPAVQGFSSAARAISWLGRRLKLWHVACAHCTATLRCARCNAGYRVRHGKPAWPWLGERHRALVAAHFAPALANYLARFEGLPGPFATIAVYGAEGDWEEALAAGGATVLAFASLAEAAAYLETSETEVTSDAGNSHASKDAPDDCTTQEPSSRSASPDDSSVHDETFADIEFEDCFSDVSCEGISTPSPLDYDHPWLLDTDRAGRPLEAPVAVPVVFEKPFPLSAHGIATQSARKAQSAPFAPCVLVQGVPMPCVVQGTPWAWPGMSSLHAGYSL